tara:strand:+ start:113 stop:538 length:426 start_codon:yes stop_codon:yes gene_type:complete
MTYKIVAKYIKDLSFEIFNSKSFFLLEKNIKNYTFVCEIKSQKIKEKIIQINVNLKLVPVVKDIDKNIDVNVELSSIVQLDQNLEKEDLEKIILIQVPTDVYSEMRSIIVFLFEKCGFNKINIQEKIDFSKLYEEKKKNQK